MTSPGQFPTLTADEVFAGASPAELPLMLMNWERGAGDVMTPVLRQRLVASGLPLHVAGLTKQHDDEPLDAA